MGIDPEIKNFLAIDFGTTNSVVHVYQNKQAKVVPSAEYGTNGSNLFPSFVEYTDNIVVGQAAKINFGRNKHFVVAAVKRILGLTYNEYEKLEDTSVFGCEVVKGEDGMPRFVVDANGRQVTPVEVASEIFKVIKLRSDKFTETEHTKAYVTVPANFKDHQCSAIRKAAEMAGLTVEKLTAEPTAAAMSWCFDHTKDIVPGEKILVYDFGGGTFDVSLIQFYTNNRFSVMTVNGNPYLGGNDLDKDSMKYVLERYHNDTGEDIGSYYKSRVKNNRVRGECEKMKMELISRSAYRDNEDEFFEKNTKINADVSLDTYGEKVVSCTLRDLYKAIRSKVQETVDITINMLKHENLTPYNIRHVIFVGGSSRIHLIKQILKPKFSRADFHDKQRDNIDPDEAVSKGCMRLVMYNYDENRRIILEEKIVISYGLQSGENDVALILKKGDRIPATSKDVGFTNSEDDQTEYHSVIYQWAGELSEAEKRRDVYIVPKDKCTAIQKLSFHNPYPQPKESQNLIIRFNLEIGGTLSVYCLDRDRNEVLTQECFPAVYGSAYFVCFEHILTIAGIFHFDV